MSIDKPIPSPKDSIEATNIEYVSLEHEQAQGDKPHILREVKKNKRVLMWCLLLYLLPINYGYETGMVGKLFAASAFQRQFGVEYQGVWTIRVPDQQLLNGANTIGTLFSAGLNGVISDRFGRKYVIIGASVLCCAGATLQTFSFTIISLFGGKLLANVGIGLGWSLAPVSSPSWPLRISVNTMIVLGQWASSLTVYGCSFRHDEWAWRIPLVVQVIPPGLLLLISVAFLPESPSWLLMHGQEEKAMAALRVFKGDGPGTEEHLKAIKRAVDMEQAARVDQESSGWADVFRQPNLRRTMIATIAFCGQQWAGVTFVSGYLPALTLCMVGNIRSLFLVERTGRRPLMVGGSVAITAGLLLIGLININPNPASLKATVAFMTIWGFIYQATLGAVAYAVAGETPTPRLRQKTLSFTMAWGIAFAGLFLQVVSYLVNPDKANLGGKVCFVFFGTSLPLCFFLFFCLPEMKGRSVEKLEEMFQERIPAHHFSKYQSDVRSPMG